MNLLLELKGDRWNSFTSCKFSVKFELTHFLLILVMSDNGFPARHFVNLKFSQ